MALPSHNVVNAPNSYVGQQAVRSALVGRYLKPLRALLRFADGSYGEACEIYRPRGADAVWQLRCRTSTTQRSTGQMTTVSVAALQGGRAGCELIIFGFIGGTDTSTAWMRESTSWPTTPVSCSVHRMASHKDGEQLGTNVEIALDEFVGMTESQVQDIPRWPLAALGAMGSTENEDEGRRTGAESDDAARRTDAERNGDNAEEES